MLLMVKPSVDVSLWLYLFLIQCTPLFLAQEKIKNMQNSHYIVASILNFTAGDNIIVKGTKSNKNTNEGKIQENRTYHYIKNKEYGSGVRLIRRLSPYTTIRTAIPCSSKLLLAIAAALPPLASSAAHPRHAYAAAGMSLRRVQSFASPSGELPRQRALSVARPPGGKLPSGASSLGGATSRRQVPRAA